MKKFCVHISPFCCRKDATTEIDLSCLTFENYGQVYYWWIHEYHNKGSVAVSN